MGSIGRRKVDVAMTLSLSGEHDELGGLYKQSCSLCGHVFNVILLSQWACLECYKGWGCGTVILQWIWCNTVWEGLYRCHCTHSGHALNDSANIICQHTWLVILARPPMKWNAWKIWGDKVIRGGTPDWYEGAGTFSCASQTRSGTFVWNDMAQRINLLPAASWTWTKLYWNWWSSR